MPRPRLHPPSALVSQSPDATAAYDQQQITAGFAATTDDLLALNDVTITNADGSSARQTLDTGAMSSAAAERHRPGRHAGHRQRRVRLGSGVAGGVELWTCGLSTTTGTRRSPSTSPGASSAASSSPAAVPLLDIGAYLQVTGTPSWVPPGPGEADMRRVHRDPRPGRRVDDRA